MSAEGARFGMPQYIPTSLKVIYFGNFARFVLDVRWHDGVEIEQNSSKSTFFEVEDLKSSIIVLINITILFPF